MTTEEPSRSVNAADLLAAIGWPTRDLDAHGPQRNRHHAAGHSDDTVAYIRAVASAEDGDLRLYENLPRDPESGRHRKMGRFTRLVHAAVAAVLDWRPRFQGAMA